MVRFYIPIADTQESILRDNQWAKSNGLNLLRDNVEEARSIEEDGWRVSLELILQGKIILLAILFVACASSVF